MTGTNLPVEADRPLRNLMSGIVGGDADDPMKRLERRAIRAIRSRARIERRDANILDQAALRKARVDRREKARKLAAEYARDRRASGHTLTTTKRERRAAQTEERVAQKRAQKEAA